MCGLAGLQGQLTLSAKDILAHRGPDAFGQYQAQETSLFHWRLSILDLSEAGNQPIPADLSQLKYGCSVTDACIDWTTTEATIRNADDVLREALQRRSAGR